MGRHPDLVEDLGDILFQIPSPVFLQIPIGLNLSGIFRILHPGFGAVAGHTAYLLDNAVFLERLHDKIVGPHSERVFCHILAACR